MANRKGQCRQYSIDTVPVYSLSAALYFKLTHLKWYYLQQLMQVFVKNGREHGNGVGLVCPLGVGHSKWKQPSTERKGLVHCIVAMAEHCYGRSDPFSLYSVPVAMEYLMVAVRQDLPSLCKSCQKCQGWDVVLSRNKWAPKVGDPQGKYTSE